MFKSIPLNTVSTKSRLLCFLFASLRDILLADLLSYCDSHFTSWNKHQLIQNTQMPKGKETRNNMKGLKRGKLPRTWRCSNNNWPKEQRNLQKRTRGGWKLEHWLSSAVMRQNICKRKHTASDARRKVKQRKTQTKWFLPCREKCNPNKKTNDFTVI